MKQIIKLSGSKDLNLTDIKLQVGNIVIDDEFSYPAIENLKITSNLDSTSEVIVKVKQNRQVATLNCGTLGSISLPDSKALRTFIDGSNLKVTVMLSDTQTNKVLARLKRPISVSLNDAEEISSPIAFGAGDTDPWLWKLDPIDEDTKPRIVLSNKIDNRIKIKNDPIFLISVFPYVLKEVLSYIWDNQLFDDDGDWIPLWRDLINALSVKWPDENQDIADQGEKHQWIEEIVDEFLSFNKGKLLNKAIEKLNQDSED